MDDQNDSSQTCSVWIDKAYSLDCACIAGNISELLLVINLPPIEIVTLAIYCRQPQGGSGSRINFLLRELLVFCTESIFNYAAEILYLVHRASSSECALLNKLPRHHPGPHPDIMSLDIRLSDTKLQEEGFQQRLLTSVHRVTELGGTERTRRLFGCYCELQYSIRDC